MVEKRNQIKNEFLGKIHMKYNLLQNLNPVNKYLMNNNIVDVDDNSKQNGVIQNGKGACHTKKVSEMSTN